MDPRVGVAFRSRAGSIASGVVSMEFLRMSVLAAPAAALAWLGRQGTRAIAAVVLIGIAVPFLIK